MEQTNFEIERKFLLSSLPPDLEEGNGSEILQGYVVLDSTGEVRVRLKDSRCYLTIKKGTGLTRSEVELAISRAHFDALWPLTEGKRLEKIRYAHSHEGFTIEIDIYRGELAPLLIAEVEFPNVEASKDFRPPTYFGDEVTGNQDYLNASLAIHGSPYRTPNEYCIGALPYTLRNKGIAILLVTNTSGMDWIVPRGKPESDKTRQDVALIEALEEAGVIGILDQGINSQCKIQDGRTLHLYPVKISTLLKKWPESSLRKRELLPLNEALERITDMSLAECIKVLAARLS
jgi:adenylate cyclase